MSYAASEISIASGQPVELYRWTHGAEVYRATSAQSAQTHDAHVYAPAPVSRSTLSQGSGIERAELEVVVPRDYAVAGLFRAGPPVERVLLTLFRRHAGDPDAEAVTVWAGRIRACEWSEDQALLRHEPVFTALRRLARARTWGHQCPHVLGDDRCGVDLAAYAVTGQVLAVNGLVLTVSNLGNPPAAYYAGGELTVTLASVLRRVMLTGSREDRVTLHMPLQGLAPGATVTLTPGCDQTWDGAGGCLKRFNNPLNYGAFPFATLQSPHGGTRIY